MVCQLAWSVISQRALTSITVVSYNFVILQERGSEKLDVHSTLTCHTRIKASKRSLYSHLQFKVFHLLFFSVQTLEKSIVQEANSSNLSAKPL